jgi:AraC family transcriptional regulator of adaptative response/methylated-DNA-[protein]-cysteine methyltransferase
VEGEGDAGIDPGRDGFDVAFAVETAARTGYGGGMSTTALPPSTEMHRAFARRDPSYDGVFFSGVRTTGIFCRPSCPARKPLPDHLEFFGTAREALFAGYRPCLRCRPLEADGRPPDWVGRLLGEVEADPSRRLTAGDLARLGVEPARARRWFQRHWGMTFSAYCRARRLGGALHALREGASLDDAALDHGFESLSGFRDAFARLFRRPPGQARGTECIVVGWVRTPLGPMIAGATGGGICFLEFTERRMLETQVRTLEKRLGLVAVPGEHPHIEGLGRELTEYFAGARRRFEVPLVAPGTPFQEEVWAALRAIPYGKTRSYAEVARGIGRASATRAVARANGTNRIAIVIPCHRVVETGGGLGGYGGGLWRKRRLLALESGERLLAE